MLRVFVITCDKYAWALKGFIHQFQKYWSELQPVVIAGYNLPDSVELPDNFTFHSISKTDYPKDKWSTGLIHFLREVKDDHFVLLLEDYWLCRGVNHQAIGTLHELCTQHKVLRMDLTDDRQFNGGARPFEPMPYYGYNDIIQTPADSAYQMSLQAGIWNRRLMLEVLNLDESAWEVEIGGTSHNAAKRDDLLVLGTLQRPVRYANVFRRGDASPEALNLEFLTQSDIDELREIGALEK